MRRLALASLLLVGCAMGGCAWRGLRPGPTDDGLAVSVAGTDPLLARRAAVESALVFFLSPAQRVAGERALDELLAKPGRFTGREKRSGPDTLVELKLDALGEALEEAGLVRPPGFPKGPGRVLIALSEPAASLGVGFAADALRRGLVARGLPAADAGDLLLKRPQLRRDSPERLAAEAFASGMDFVLLGGALAESVPEAESGAHRAEAVLDARLKAAASDPGVLIEASTSALDVSSAAAVARALEQAGEEASARVADAVAAARAGREEVYVEARGAGGPARMAALITALRSLTGVQGAALARHRTEEGAALVRVFAAGLKADELAARLIRADPGVVMLGVEPENRRLVVELGAGGSFLP